ncbi:hypothetical protein G647_10105 [Cladophialophora carrionii CBS 160.54]|uniref:Rhodopsin domain-containing protein n=1 Tax=Cladophialophora carrionii CBS 160.54 TaxID=1279043 RepID=V9DJZ4_9EURO|nr:uncharacterized protein G647_10105 [Cladophialophora carrionii CBS 160.54]ETI27006.1 hypothetical protein G647_10105 [Cladophialophora carrionii CBS 160.54]
MRSQITNDEAKTANWVSIGLAIVILLVRFICGQHYRKSALDITTGVVLASIAILIARIVISNYVLEYGTADDVLLAGAIHYESLDLDQIKTGTILSLISRLLITTVYWLQCILLLLFYTRILAHIHWVKLCVRVTWVVIGASYIAVVFATFLECRPFRLYWQIQPDPGSCVQAYVQLFVQCICNIIIDLLLLAISYPVLRTRGHKWSQKCRIAFLYVLGSFCIIITCIRVAYIHGSNSAQPARSFWASVQGVISTFVANTPSIYGQLKLKLREKTQSSEGRRRGDTQPDTYVLMDEMNRRVSRPPGEDVEDVASNPTLGSDSLKQRKGEDKSFWVSEAEIPQPDGIGKESNQ